MATMVNTAVPNNHRKHINDNLIVRRDEKKMIKQWLQNNVEDIQDKINAINLNDQWSS